LPVDHKKIKGGVESATLNLLDGFLLHKNNNEVRVLSLNTNVDADIYYKERIRVTYVTIKDLFAINYFKIKRILDHYRPNVIHIQGTGPQLLNFLFFKKNNIVITQHGVLTHEYHTKVEYADKLKFYLKYKIERYIYPKFKNYIMISAYNKMNYAGTLENKCSATIPNAIPLEYCNTYKNDFRYKNDILYVGGLYSGKNILLLINSLKILLDEGISYKLTIAGDFKEQSYKRTIMNAINSPGMSSKVKFLGWVDKNKVLSLLKEHSIFVLSSNQEALPMSIAEAMATGRIVIATSVGGIPEMIKHGATGFLFQKENQNELVEILRNIHRNKYDLENISMNAHNYALEAYHPKAIAKKTLDFYEKAIDQNN